MAHLSEWPCCCSAHRLPAARRRHRPSLCGICAALSVSGLAAGLYATLQYFGADPLLPQAAYQAGEGPFRIVRPPATLGHSDYLGVFLLWAAFAGVAVALGGASQGLDCPLAGSRSAPRSPGCC